MGLFSKKPANNPAPAVTNSGPALDLGKQSGALTLEKGSRVTIEKSPLLTTRVTWSSNTDYDIYALVVLKSGKVLTVATFGSEAERNPQQAVLNGAVRHLGDVGRGSAGLAQEIIEIKMTDEIAAVIPVAYSAQSNGTGSFKRYKVSLEIDNGAGTKVTVDAKHANNNDTIYSVAIGIIRNTADGVQIEALEKYSKPGSENRPAFINGEVVMDAGSRNLYK